DRVVRDRVAPERDAVGGAERLVAEGLVDDSRSRPQRAHPFVHEAAERTRFGAGHERDLATLTTFDQRGELLAKVLLGVVPADGLARGERSAHAVGVIEALQSRLTSNTQRSLVDAMMLVALELDDAALAIPRDDPASRWAFPTHGREVGGDTGDDVLRRRDVGKVFFGRCPAASHCCRGSRRANDLEECPAVEPALPLSLWSAAHWTSHSRGGRINPVDSPRARGNGEAIRVPEYPTSRCVPVTLVAPRLATPVNCGWFRVWSAHCATH